MEEPCDKMALDMKEPEFVNRVDVKGLFSPGHLGKSVTSG